MSVVQANQLNREGFGSFATRPDSVKENGEFRIAGFNLQTAFVTDSEKNAREYPQYCWDNRAKLLINLIQQDKPAVLAIYEFNMKQAVTLRKYLEDQYTLIGYSSEMGKSIEEVEVLIKQAEHQRLDGKDIKDPYYGEFVGFLVANDTFEVIDEGVRCHALPKGARHGRVLVEIGLIHQATKTHIVAFSSHFDHLSLESREKSGAVELDLISQYQKNGIPCITFGDRNFFPDAGGQECYEMYIKSGLLTDTRDSEGGHYGPEGTFPGHLGLPERFAPKIIQDKRGRVIIDANTIDVGFVTKEFSIKNSYSYFGAFDPNSGELLTNENPGDLKEKPFLSDHYYIGATVTLNQRGSN